MIPGNHLVWGEQLWCEPMTVGTDGLLALLCLALMGRHRGVGRGVFGFASIAFAFGGLRHLLFAQSPALVPGLSRVSNVANSLSLTLLLLAMPVLWGTRRTWIGVLAAVVIAGHLWLDHILLSVLHSAIAFFAALGAVTWQRLWRDFRWFVVAFVLSALAGLVFGLRLAPTLFFNHNDLAHIFLLGTYIALHRQLSPSAQNAVRP